MCRKSANQMTTKNEWLKWRLTYRANNECLICIRRTSKIILCINLLFIFNTSGGGCGWALKALSPQVLAESETWWTEMIDYVTVVSGYILMFAHCTLQLRNYSIETAESRMNSDGEWCGRLPFTILYPWVIVVCNQNYAYCSLVSATVCVVFPSGCRDHSSGRGGLCHRQCCRV